MPPYLVAVCLLLPFCLGIENKFPRHVGSASGFAGGSSFASSSAYSSAGGFSGSSGVKGGCGGCGGSKAGFPGFGSSGAGSFASAGSQIPGDLSNAAFWWAGPDSPFKEAQEYYKKCALKGDCANVPGPFKIPGFNQNAGPCGPSGCVSNIPGKGSIGPLDLSQNPFLNGEIKGVAISSCTGNACPGGKPHVTVTNCKGSECKTVKHEGEAQKPLDLSGNPFLSGTFGTGTFGSGSYFGGSSSGSGSFKGSHGAGSEIAHGAGGSHTLTTTGTQGQVYPTSGTQGGSTGLHQGASFGSGQSNLQTSGSFPTSGPQTTFQHGSFGGSQTSGSFGGSQSGTFHTSFGTQPTAPSKTDFGTSGSGSFSSSGGSGSSCGFGTACQGQNIPSKEITPPPFGGQKPSCTGFGCASGQDKQGQGTYQPSGTGVQPGKGCYPGQLGCQQPIGSGVQPGCYPGKPGCDLPTGSGVQPTGSAQCYPGKPGCGQPAGQPSCQPGQPGCNKPIPSHPDRPCYPGQPGCSQTSFQGSFSGTSGSGVSQSNCYPGKPGCGSQGQFGSFGQTGLGQTGQGQTGQGQTGQGQFGQGQFGQGPSGQGQTGQGQAGQGQFGQSGQKCYPGQPGCTTGSQPTNYPTGAEGQLTLRCGGQGYFCVEKYQCNNGIINTNGEGLLQSKVSGDQFCNVNTQVCCRLPTYYHSSSSSASSAASSATSSNSNTYFTSGPGAPSHGPTVASHIANQYTPQKPGDSTYSGSGLIHVPAKDLRPGQTVPFGGNDGNSPGLIHVLPESSSTRPYTPGGGLIHVAPGQTKDQPGLIHVKPNGDTDIPRPFTSGPNSVYVTSNGKPFGSSAHDTFKDTKNELGFASTIQGPAYLPPDNSPTPTVYTTDLEPPKVIYPSPSSTNNNVLIPQKPSTTTPRVYYTPKPTQKVYTPSQPVYSPTTPKPVYTPPRTPPSYLPPQQPSGTSVTNSYLPPQEPDSNIIHVNILKPPTEPNLNREGAGAGISETRLTPPTSPRPLPPRPIPGRTTPYPFGGDLNTTPYPGCAAALKCVEAQFCTAEGVMSTVPVVLTKEQEHLRVPLTECTDPESGITGKCCRDPNYVDPWPASQLGLYNPDNGFDNGQYKETRNEGKYAKPPISGRPIGTNLPIAPQPGIKGRPYQPNQVGSPSNQPGTFVRPDNQGYPSQVPGIPFDYRQVNKPLQVDVKSPIEINLNGKQPYSPSKISSGSCGVRRPGGNPRGAAPIDVDFAEIPWQAMILRDSILKENRSLLCGGAIIRRDAVLTAAHCVEGLHSDDVLVKGGEWKLGIDEEPKPFQIIKVAAIVRHPGYNPDTKLNDVAILVLTEKFRIDKNVDTICLPAPDTNVEATFQNAKCITTGWGKTILQLHLLNALMHSLDVGIVPSSQCQQTLQQYHQSSAPYYNTNCVCGATKQQNTDICDVDIGSALACDLGDGHYTLAGVYSWDTGCRTQSQLAGYTKVDTYWIEQQLQRPINDLKVEENGFYQRLNKQSADCHCKNGKK